MTAVVVESPTVTDAGLVEGMTDEAYHGDPVPGGSLSSTFARLLTEHVPAKARELHLNRKPTKAMNLGKAAHREALGVGPELVVWQHDGRTKAGKAERADWRERIDSEAAVAVTQDEHDQILGMAAALRTDRLVADLFDVARHEVSGFVQDPDTGVWMRARYDLLAEAQADDYKTTQKATRREFGKSMASFGYHQQADWYLRVLRLLEHSAAERPFRFITQETTAPYLIQIHTPNEEAMWIATELNERALRIYAECSAAGVWPGYEQTFVEEPAELPAYYFLDHADVIPERFLPLHDDIAGV